MSLWNWRQAAFSIVIGIAFSASLSPAEAAEENQGYLFAINTECRIWTNDFSGIKEVHWDGACENGKGSGPGILVYHYWEDDEATSTATYAGTLVEGKLEGHVTADYSSGNTFAGNFKNHLREGYGTFKWADGRSYVGEYQSDQLHGHGKFTWADGTYYEGSLENGLSNGSGVQTYADGSRYVGEWKDDKPNGDGMKVYPNGDTYSGLWQDGIRQGQGTYQWADGSYYEGGFKDDLSEGHGIRVYADGTRYDGEWKNDKRHGLGRMIDASGEGVLSEWVEGEQKAGSRLASLQAAMAALEPIALIETTAENAPNDNTTESDQNSDADHTQNVAAQSDASESPVLARLGEAGYMRAEDTGCLIWDTNYQKGDRVEWNGDCSGGKGNGFGMVLFHYQDGDDKAQYVVYEVSLVDGKMEGPGRAKYSDGGYFEGSFKNHLRDGHGQAVFANGTQYVGSYKNGKFHGQGKYTYADGGTYEGELKNGKSNGHGVEVRPSGTRYEGQWKDDQRHGQGTMAYSNGHRYEGQWKNDKRHGQGTYIFNNDGTYVGEFKNDDFDGFGVRTYGAGDRYEGQWQEDKKHGLGKRYSADGSDVSDQEWSNGKEVFRNADGSIDHPWAILNALLDMPVSKEQLSRRSREIENNPYLNGQMIDRDIDGLGGGDDASYTDTAAEQREAEAQRAREAEAEQAREQEREYQSAIDNFRFPSSNCSRPSLPLLNASDSQIDQFTNNQIGWVRCLNDAADRDYRALRSLIVNELDGDWSESGDTINWSVACDCTDEVSDLFESAENRRSSRDRQIASLDQDIRNHNNSKQLMNNVNAMRRMNEQMQQQQPDYSNRYDPGYSGGYSGGNSGNYGGSFDPGYSGGGFLGGTN